MVSNKQNRVVSVVGSLFFMLTIFFVIVPIVFDFSKVNWFFKILMILSSLIVAIIFVFNFVVNRKNINFKFVFANLFLIIPYLIGIVHYFSFDLWGYKVQTWAYFFVVLLLIGIVMNGYDHAKGLSKDNVIRIVLTVCFVFFMFGIFGIETLGFNNLYFKIAIGIFYLYVLLSLIEAYLLGKTKIKYKTRYESAILLVKILIVIAAIFTFPVYVEWLGLKDKALEYFIQIYACVLGGIITLAGVSWTIKDQNKNRKQDELLKYKPLFYPVELSNANRKKIKPLEITFTSQNVKFKKVLCMGIIENSDNSIVLLKKCIINGMEFFPLNNGIVAKSKSYMILIQINKLSINDDIKLIVTDVLNNEYIYTIKLVGTKDKELVVWNILSIEEIKN